MIAFLKPTLWKLILGLFLFFISDCLWRFTIGLSIMDVSYFGQPWHYFIAWGPCQAGQNCSEFHGMYLILDLVFWYLISAAFMTWLWRKKV